MGLTSKQVDKEIQTLAEEHNWSSASLLDILKEIQSSFILVNKITNCEEVAWK